ncbi:MAG TPA: hypothetical protein PLF40_18500 [Kofleriaceae bacterium]|nr:hypothetical protein [Kofleriaceae bacterium]
MQLGKARSKLSLSLSHRRVSGIKLGISHHGTPADWQAPTKEPVEVAPPKPKPKRR